MISHAEHSTLIGCLGPSHVFQEDAERVSPPLKAGECTQWLATAHSGLLVDADHSAPSAQLLHLQGTVRSEKFGRKHI